MRDMRHLDVTGVNVVTWTLSYAVQPAFKIQTKYGVREDVYHKFWLLMIPYYCEKWLEGNCYDELMKEHKLNTNDDG